MNKTLTIAVVIGAVVIFGLAAALVFVKKQGPQTQTPSSTSTTTAGEEQSQDKKSIKDLFTLNTPQECSFSDELGNSGTVYTKNGAMRVQSTTKNAQGDINSNVIVKEQTAYVWMEGQNTGVKIAYDPASTATTANASSSAQTVDLEQKVNYSCKGWSVNDSLFTPPSSVTFTDLGQVNAPSATFDSCAACNVLDAEAKAACRSTFKCK